MSGVSSRSWRTVVLLASVAIAIVGCSSSASTAAPSTAAGQSPAGLTTVKYVPDWTSSWPGWVPWVGALEKGWFKEAGIDLQVVLPPTGSDPPKFVGTGKADMATSIGGDLLFAASQGLESTVVASLADRIPEGIACWPDKVKKPEDLYGKTVAIYNFPSAMLYWDFFTKHYKLDTSKIKVVDEGADGVPLALAKTADCIDAAASGELVFFQIKSGVTPTYFVYDESNGVPKIQNSLLSVNKDFLASHPDVVRAWVGVWFKAIHYMQANETQKKEFIDAYVKAYPENDVQAATLGVDAMIKYAYPPYYPDQKDGWISPDGWTSLYQILIDSKQIETPIDNPTHLISNDYLP
jgi:putative hydroxymethylpyrimidine transport system substrate-binding protein